MPIDRGCSNPRKRSAIRKISDYFMPFDTADLTESSQQPHSTNYVENVTVNDQSEGKKSTALRT